MTSFLGVPIVIRGEAWGNLYLTEKAGGEDSTPLTRSRSSCWPTGPRSRSRTPASTRASTARRAELERAVRGLEATSAVAQALGTETDLDRVLELIVKRARALVEARGVLVLLADGDELVIAAAAGQVDAARSSGFRMSRGPLRRRASSARSRCASTTSTPSAAGQRAARSPGRIDRAARPARLPRPRRSACCARSTASTSSRRSTPRTKACCVRSPPARRPPSPRRVRSKRIACAGAGLGRGRAPPLGARAARRDASGASARSRCCSPARRGAGPGRVRASLERRRRSGVARDREPARLIAELRPAALDALGLAPALRTLVDARRRPPGSRSRRRSSSARTAAPATGAGDGGLPRRPGGPDQHRKTRARHARRGRRPIARTAPSSSACPTTAWASTPDKPTRGFGLVGMRERVALAGGTLTLEAANPGSRLVATFPLEPQLTAQPCAAAGTAPRPRSASTRARYGASQREAILLGGHQSGSSLIADVPSGSSSSARRIARPLAGHQQPAQHRSQRRRHRRRAPSRAAMCDAAASACCAASPPCLIGTVVPSPAA